MRIVLATDSADDIEEIDDLKTEFEALLPIQVDFDVEVAVSKAPILLDPPGESTIVVFRRRE